MLPKFYRFYIVNNSGDTLTYANAARLEIRTLPWKFDSNGALSYGTVDVDTTALLDTGETIADGIASEGTVIDNTSNKYLGLNGYLECKHDVDTGPDAIIDLYVEHSDDNASWPSDQDDFLAEEDGIWVAGLAIVTTAVDRTRGTNFSW